jgi:RHS repeat-associated protein
VCLGLPAQIWARDGKAGPVSPHIDGNRIAKSVQGNATTTTRYLVDTNNPTGYAQVVEEHESSAALLPAASGSLTTVYAYGHDLISQDRLTQPGTWHLSYYLYDGGGHVRALATTTAALTDSYSYDAYGILIASTGTTTNNYLYRGEQFDPDLKLYYQRARYLNAETGRFWTQDTYEGSPGTPASLHKYLYANSDPVGGWDPSGYVFIANFFFGNAVHKAIGADFEGRGFGVSDEPIAELIGRVPNFSWLRPDLTTPASGMVPGFVWEIKSVVSGYVEASAQLWLYLGILNTYDPAGRLWLPGLHYIPPPVIYVGRGTFALVTVSGPGVILYEVVNGEEAIAWTLVALGAVALYKPAADLSVALLLNAMGGPA